jgi:integrase
MSVFLRKGSPYYYCEFIVQGHRVFKSTKKRTEREARQRERELRAEKVAELAATAGAAASDKLTIDQCFGKYRKQELHKLSATWQSEVERYGLLILSTIDPNMAMEDVSDAEIDEFVQAHVAAGGGKYALNRALSIWRRVHRLSKTKWKQKCQVIDWAEHRNPEEERVKFFKVQEAKRLLEVAYYTVAEMIEWTFYTGCRRSETFKLTRDNLDLQEGKATVIAKGGKKHILWLNADAMALLARIPNRGRYVFDSTNWRKHWVAALKKAGLPWQGPDAFRWHDTRHTFATWLRQSGAPMEIVQRGLGHANLSTSTRYAHVDDKELKDALQKLPSLNLSGESKVVSIRKGRKG